MRRSKSNARRTPIQLAATTLAAVTAVASVGVLGCEDGPNQTYSPATPAETAVWNNPGGSNVSPSSKDFSYLSGGTNANVICNGPTLAKVWAAMDKQPMIPPVEAGGLDMAGPGCTPTSTTCTWPGITIEQAEQILCQSTNDGDLFGDGELANSWGDNGELIAHYLITTHKIDFLWIQPGYLGTITATGCMGVDGKPTASMGHTYQIPLGTQLLKDSMPWDINWADPKTSTDWRNELTSALTCQFQPTLATSADCNSTGACVQGSFGDEAYIAVSPLGFLSFYIANQYAAQPVPSIMGAIQMPLAKITPFGNAAINLKIDDVGPTAVAGVLNTQTNTPCTMQFGATFGDFLSECVETTGNMTTDLGNYNKLIGGIQHDDERFYFNIQGVDLNFGDSRLMPTQVAGDQDIPASTDTASNFSIDQNTLGPIVHDYAGNDTTQTKDCHGNGLVMTEMMRIAQATLNQEEVAQGNAAFTHYLGDPACADTNPGGPAAGCTGLETVITTAPQALISATTTLPATIACNAGNGSLGYDKFADTDRPGACDTTGNLVTVPTTLTAPELAMLTNVGLPAGIDITALDAPPPLASQRLGHAARYAERGVLPRDGELRPWLSDEPAGLPDHVPGSHRPDVGRPHQGDRGSRRHRQAAGRCAGLAVLLPRVRPGAREVPEGGRRGGHRRYGCIGDHAGGHRLAVHRSVQHLLRLDRRRTVRGGRVHRAGVRDVRTDGQRTRPGGGPNVTLDFVFSADVIHGIMNGYDYYKYLYRGETALYLADADARDGVGHPIASQDNTLLTNLVGSPVILGGWSDHTSDFGATDCAGGPCTAFYCGTHNDSAHCAGQIAPHGQHAHGAPDAAGRLREPVPRGVRGRVHRQRHGVHHRRRDRHELAGRHQHRQELRRHRHGHLREHPGDLRPGPASREPVRL